MARGETVRIATRKSPLALWQARAVGTMLQQRWPAMAVELVELSTEGDRVLDTPLSRIGGKGLFIKELEAALLDGRADLAVHSLKDVTSAFPPGLVLAAVPDREDPRDAWVSPGGVPYAALPRGARVGTSSLRRACQLRAARPDVEVVPLRGNVGTRVRKTAELGLAGAILALAGLRRLGLEGEVTEVLPVEVMLPAVGQGALALECRAEAPLRAQLEALEHARTRVGVEAERGFLEALEGGCTVPLAAHAVWEGESLWVRGLVGAPDGSEVLRAERRGPPAEARALGRSLAAELLDRGARALLASHAGERSGV
jgi:hydroxymethylbilane synthase